MARLAIVLALLTAGVAAPAQAAYAPVQQLGATGGGILRFPQAVAVDPADGGVWVADQHSFLVQRFDAQGRFVRQIGGYGQGAGQLGRVSPAGTIGGVGGLAVGPDGTLYVLDSFNDRIQRFTREGAYLGQSGARGSGPGQFDLGLNGGIAVAGSRVYVADQNNQRVQELRPDGSFVRAFGSSGSGDGQLDNPEGVAVDPATGDVFVADNQNDRVQRFSASGAFEAKAGSFGSGNGQFESPYDVGVENGKLYVADNENHRVQRFDAQTLAWEASFGSFGTGPDQVGFPRSLAALATDPDGGGYVGDTSNNRVQRFTRAGAFVRAFGTSGRADGTLTIPGGVAVEPGGGLLVADTVQHRIQRFAADGSFRAWYGRRSSLGTPTPASTDGDFREPQGVASTPDGGFWVADAGNHRVQRFDAGGGFVLRAGGPAQGTAPGQFRAPRGLAVEPDGDLIVGDTGNDRLQRRDAATGAWTVIATAVQKPSEVDRAPDGRLLVAETDADRLLILGPDGARAGEVAGLEAPEGVTVAADGSVFVTETGADRVARLAPSGGGYAVAERFGGGRGGVSGQFAEPAGLAADGSGGVWVVDRYNSRLQRFAEPEPTPTPTATVPPAPAPAAVAGPAAGSAAAGSPVAPAPRTAGRIALRRLTLRATPRRDRRRPYRLRVAGRLTPARPVACSGRITLTVRRGRRVVLRRRATVRRGCAYTATLRLPARARGRVSISARFAGNAALAPGSARRRTVRLG